MSSLHSSAGRCLPRLWSSNRWCQGQIFTFSGVLDASRLWQCFGDFCLQCLLIQDCVHPAFHSWFGVVIRSGYNFIYLYIKFQIASHDGLFHSGMIGSTKQQHDVLNGVGRRHTSTHFLHWTEWAKCFMCITFHAVGFTCPPKHPSFQLATALVNLESLQQVPSMAPVNCAMCTVFLL